MGAIAFAAFGVAPLAAVLLSDGPAVFTASPWLIFPTLIYAGGWLFVAVYTWAEIPPRLVVSRLEDATTLFNDRPIVLTCGPSVIMLTF